MVTRLARTAVEGRLDTLWLGDGLLENNDFPVWAGGMESFTELAWLAGAFPDARIGITAAVLPLRDVLWVAKQAATLDHLCDGEFVLAVTPGFWEREFAYLGLDFAARGRVFEERVAELRDLLAARPGMGGPSPPPLTSGGPPMWLAGAEATMKRALRLGMPYQASPTTPEALAPAARRWFEAGGGTLGVRVRMEIGHAPGGDEAVPWNL